MRGLPPLGTAVDESYSQAGIIVTVHVRHRINTLSIGDRVGINAHESDMILPKISLRLLRFHDNGQICPAIAIEITEQVRVRQHGWEHLHFWPECMLYHGCDMVKGYLRVSWGGAAVGLSIDVCIRVVP